MTDPELVKICINFSYFTTISVLQENIRKSAQSEAKSISVQPNL